jgi:sodium-dependent phosphate cotransporter
VRVASLVAYLYAFLVSIGLLAAAFNAFGGGFVTGLIESASNPLVGLFVGILTTTLVQSSSTTTSIVVAMVGGGVMPISTAIPVVMGANIGTSVTNTLVSLGHIGRGPEFYRAFAASTVHDFFNITAVLLIFPLELLTGVLERGSAVLADLFGQAGGLTFASPLKLATAPAVAGLGELLGGSAWLLLALALALMFGSLRQLVRTLKSLVLTRAQVFFDTVIFRSTLRAMAFGVAMTVLVQSSSITTSLVIPLAGAGLLSLRQVFPYTLGANVGTTITAILAALATGQLAAVTVAFAHLLFNLLGIAVIWPIAPLRALPIALAQRLSALAVRQRTLPVVYIVLFFYLLPLVVIWALR